MKSRVRRKLHANLKGMSMEVRRKQTRKGGESCGWNKARGAVRWLQNGKTCIAIAYITHSTF